MKQQQKDNISESIAITVIAAILGIISGIAIYTVWTSIAHNSDPNTGFIISYITMCTIYGTITGIYASLIILTAEEKDIKEKTYMNESNRNKIEENISIYTSMFVGIAIGYIIYNLALVDTNITEQNESEMYLFMITSGFYTFAIKILAITYNLVKKQKSQNKN